MDTFISNHEYLSFGMGLYVLQIFRYVIFAGIGWLLFYQLFRNAWLHKKIQQRFPKKKNIVNEIKYSISSLAIFALTGMFTYWATKQGWTRMYTEITDYGWLYYGFSILVCIILHDTYFYWTHRLMHVKWIFPYVHKVHHYSHNPSPWAAFSFHPLEAIIEAGIVPLIVFALPIHRSALLLFLLYMTAMNVMGHLGFELYPKGFTKHWLGKWQNTSTHHNMHHHYTKCNFGLYFNFWDRIMGTNHAKYHEHFEHVASAKKEEEKEKIEIVAKYNKY